MILSCLHVDFIVFVVCLTIGISIASGPVCPADGKKEWSYRPDLKNGPEHWKEKYDGCNGNKQSPINIKTSETVKADKPQILKVKNFDIPISDIILYNTGKYISFTPNDGVSRSVFLDGKEYPLSTFHFHWGNSTNGLGSEHAINGKKFPVEAHFILPGDNGLVAEISVLFEVNDEINPVFDNLISVQPQIQYYGDTFQGEIQRDNPDPKRRGKLYLDDVVDFECPFYRYKGSISVPPCSENSIWMICKTKKFVGRSQLDQLYKTNCVKKKRVNDKDDCTLKNIFRPLQEPNGRKVYE